MFKSIWNKIVSFVKNFVGCVRYGYTSTREYTLLDDQIEAPADKKDFCWKTFFRGEYRTANTGFKATNRALSYRSEARALVRKIRLTSLIISLFVWWPAVFVGFGVCVLVDVQTSVKVRDALYY